MQFRTRHPASVIDVALARLAVGRRLHGTRAISPMVTHRPTKLDSGAGGHCGWQSRPGKQVAGRSAVRDIRSLPGDAPADENTRQGDDGGAQRSVVTGRCRGWQSSARQRQVPQIAPPRMSLPRPRASKTLPPPWRAVFEGIRRDLRDRRDLCRMSTLQQTTDGSESDPLGLGAYRTGPLFHAA